MPWNPSHSKGIGRQNFFQEFVLIKLDKIVAVGYSSVAPEITAKERILFFDKLAAL